MFLVLVSITLSCICRGLSKDCLLWIVCCLMVSPYVHAQQGINVTIPDVSIESFSIRQGLSNPVVNCIAKDAQGFLWVGTQNGISRFDGYGFVSYWRDAGKLDYLKTGPVEYMQAGDKNELLLFNSVNGSVEVFNTISAKATLLPDNGHYGYRGVADKSSRLASELYLMARQNERDVIYRYKQGEIKFDSAMKGIIGIPGGRYEHCDFVNDKDGTFWIAYRTDIHLVVYHVNAGGAVIQRYGIEKISPGTDIKTDKEDQVGISIYQALNGRIFLSIKNRGLYYLDDDRNEFTHLHLPQNAYFSLAEDTLGSLLAYDEGSEAGAKTAWLIDKSLHITDYTSVVAGMARLNAAYSDDFRAWLIIGGNDGLRKIWLKPRVFASYLTGNVAGASGTNSMRGLGRDQAGDILFAAETGGVYALTSGGAIVRPGNTAPGLSYLNELKYPRTVLTVGDSMMLLGHASGLLEYFPIQKKLQHYKVQDGVSALAKDKNGLVWLSSFNQRLYSFNPASRKLQQYLNNDGTDPLAGYGSEFLLFDKIGRLWVGTSKGLLQINTKTGQSKFYNVNPYGGNYAVVCIYEDERGMLWLGTLLGGLQLFDPAKGKILATFGHKEGLCNDNVASIVPGDNGNLWLGTYFGLSSFNRRNNSFINFYDFDGLPGNEFNRHSFFRDPVTRRFYFGGINGITAFYQEDVIKPAMNAQVLVSQASYMSPNGKDRVEQYFDLTDGATIELPAVNRLLSLKLGLTNYENPAGNQFSYKVEGVDEDWNYLGSERVINFSYLPAGRHVLHLRGAVGHRGWSASEVRITLLVHDFWYNLWWVRISVSALVVLSAFFYYRFLLRRRLALQETNRLAELDAFKTRFFTNITHEFRTPLTIILGAMGQIDQGVVAGGAVDTNKVNKYTGLARRSGESLLRLINQILDLARLDNSSLNIRYIHGDIVAYVRYVAGSLHALAEANGVAVTVQSHTDSVFMDYDPDRLLQVVYNLISNGLKFTPPGGTVHISIEPHEPGMLAIAVADTGVGIPPEDMPNIFERFYQAKNQEAANGGGSGIGLAFVKELLKAMGGSASVKSTLGKGSVFTILLPITQKASVPLYPLPMHDNGNGLQEETALAVDDALPLLLVIEDNPDLVGLLTDSLRGIYRIDFAYNGGEGIEKALALIPDIIISDLMMPVKDGFEVLATLKSDMRTSHIPIILLTAMAMVEDRIAGIGRGADVYLTKPFHHGELLAAIKNLLDGRKKLQARYALLPQPEMAGVLQADKELKPDIWNGGIELLMEDSFIKQLHTFVMERLDNPDLSLEQVCQAMGLSESVLYRKLTALTGHSLIPFIRIIRLQKAKALLLETSKSVSEIAYETGFSNASFFSRVFLQEFGVRPKTFRDGAAT